MLIEDEWKALIDGAVPGLNKKSGQYADMRKMFYAGVAVAMKTMINSADFDNEGEAIIESMLDEMQTFRREIDKSIAGYN